LLLFGNEGELLRFKTTDLRWSFRIRTYTITKLVDLSCRFGGRPFLFNSIVAWAVCFGGCAAGADAKWAGLTQQNQEMGPPNLHELISGLTITVHA